MPNRLDPTHSSPQSHQARSAKSEIPFAPTNPLENALVEANAGRLEHRDLLKIFVDSEVYEITNDAPRCEDDPCFPLSFQDPDQGRMIAVFSDPSRTASFQEQAPHVLALSGSQVFQSLPAGHGIVLNPGSEVELTIPGYGVLNIRRDFGIRRVVE
ncbi:SseB family protein [Blastopirellula sp. J2-11]|uniref:SseB family protein n=1 Tax=Blastopirellula sp. J2-11 TaxID=2943192 RepID=UPI0021C764E6|nr:SseB family protein [Blastopirellula sp. J2-11]UUO06929.1 SseB family protein [Blastopirellula sp. J2-11]